MTCLLFLLSACYLRPATGGNANRPAVNNQASPLPSRLMIDMHVDTLQRVVDEQVDLTRRLSDGHFDLPRAKDGGLRGQFFSVWVEPSLYAAGGPRAIKRADDQIAALRAAIANHSGEWELATSGAELRRIVGSGKLAALLGLEGGYAIDNRLENVDRYYHLGVRYMSPTWTVSTDWAGSSGDEIGRTRGLSEFGRTVVQEMDRLGMMVDVSHVSDPTFWDIIRTSRRPVIASHSACRAIAAIPRNLDDEMIRAVAKSGGIICLPFYPAFLEPGWSDRQAGVDVAIAPLVRAASDAASGGIARQRVARDVVRRTEYARRLPPVSLKRLVDHIDRIVRLVGIDCVGIGSDFDGVQAVLSDLPSVADLPNLVRELQRRGYSEGDIDKIMGGNILRVLDQLEQR